MRAALVCGSCQAGLAPPGKIYQCYRGHSLCQHCRHQPLLLAGLDGDLLCGRMDGLDCAVCGGFIAGRNTAGENLAALLFPPSHPASSVSSHSASSASSAASLKSV